jgi:hypothetical protein
VSNTSAVSHDESNFYILNVDLHELSINNI